ncbi:MAG: XdhC and CoxI family protein [Clostridiales bacterium]|nr:XdhC and CoxI family protein [Clostridiales bacterium]
MARKNQLYHKIATIIRDYGHVRTAIILTGTNAGCRCFWHPDGRISCDSLDTQAFFDKWILPNSIKSLEKIIIGGEDVLVEFLVKAPRLVIMGGGHVSLPLVSIGKMLGFYVIVADDRPEYANRGRFPEADEVFCMEPEEFKENIPDKANSYYIIVTRGHMYDEAYASHILNYSADYIGMIGSKTKAAKTKGTLQECFSKEQVGYLHSPIGLDIGAKTPAEIAVSIFGEIIRVKSMKKLHRLPEDVYNKLLYEDTKGVMVTVIEKKGSSPAGIGSRMLVLDDGLVLGTIGGGSLEHEAITRSKKLLRSSSINCRLNEGGSLGMVCGGNIDVLFEKVGS